MSRKKGLSAEEKKVRAQEYFHETKEAFTLKDLEKYLPKHKGIVSMSVKDVIKSLVDDDLIISDKIGTGTYFWSFPSEAYNSRKVKINELTTQKNDLKRKRKELTNTKNEALEGKEESEERNTKLLKLKELEEENGNLKEELRRLSDLDPEKLENMKNDCKLATEAANRWTDNIFTLKSHLGKKYSINGKQFSQQFQIPEDFDYIEQ